MARYVFPADRWAYDFQPAPQSGLLNAAGQSIQIFIDKETTQLADIHDLNNHPIANSIITVGNDSLLPEFYGPDEIKKLYARTPLGTADQAVQLDANLVGRVEFLENNAALRDEIAYVHSQSTPAAVWTIHHPLGYRPAGIVVIDSSNNEVEGDVAYPDIATVVLTFSGAFSGTAYLS